MTALISKEYLDLNTDLHETHSHYGKSGVRWATKIEKLIHTIKAISILDYGCGKQTLGMAIPHLLVQGYDPALKGLDATPEPADLVVCTDVLEHIEPECLDAVLDDLKRCTLVAIFLTVAIEPALKHLADGRNAHLIVEHPDWWVPKIMRRWDVQQFDLMDGEFAVLGLKKVPGTKLYLKEATR